MVVGLSLQFSVPLLEHSVVIFPICSVSKDNFQVSISLNYVETEWLCVLKNIEIFAACNDTSPLTQVKFV